MIRLLKGCGIGLGVLVGLEVGLPYVEKFIVWVWP